MSKNKKYCVYIHTRKSDGKPFYVGKGLRKRADDSSNRSVWWKKIAAKNGRKVNIIIEDKYNVCCCTLEKILIYKIGRENLCNMTDGGDGTPGFKQSDHQKKVMSEFSKSRGGVPRFGIEKSAMIRSKPFGTKCGLRFSSITEAAKFIGNKNTATTVSALRASANGHTDKVYGYKWGYIEDGKFSLKEYKWREYITINVNCSNGMVFSGVPDAIKWLKSIGFIKACPSYLSKACRGDRNSAYGYRWEYV